MQQPLISIITPNYNSEKFIAETIESVVSQSYKNWELLIVDDCSTDNSTIIIEEFIEKDKRIQLIKLQQNGGAAITRNKGVSLAKGDYIAFLDSDDRWFVDKLTKQLSFMLDKDIAFSFTSYYSVSEQKTDQKLINVKQTINYKQLLTNNYIGCLTVMYSVKKIGKVYFPNIIKRQDWALWLKITRSNIVAYGIQEPLAWYTRRNYSLSSKKVNLLKYNWLVYRKFERIHFLKAVFLMIQLIIKKFSK